jgi:hypothetical protein
VALKVSRHWPLILLVWVSWREDKAMRSKEDRAEVRFNSLTENSISITKIFANKGPWKIFRCKKELMNVTQQGTSPSGLCYVT